MCVNGVDVGSELDQQRHHIVVTLAREDAGQRRSIEVVGGVTGRGPGEQQQPGNLQNVKQSCTKMSFRCTRKQVRKCTLTFGLETLRTAPRAREASSVDMDTQSA